MAFSEHFTKKPLTDIFTSDTCINRRTCRRLVPMKVLILGLGRTGTSSMREAMKQLGYVDTYHMMSASIENPPDALLWRDAFAAKYHGGPKFTRADWDQLLGHCQAVCDWPAIAFAPELIAAYPDAKVILTTRSFNSWYTSTLSTVYWRATDPFLRYLSYISWGASLYHPLLTTFFSTFFESAFLDRERVRQIFEGHYDEVRTLVPREKLLEFEVRQGWGPLCGFLGEEVPKAAFPHVNDGRDFRRRTMRRNWMQLWNVLLGWLVTLVMVGVCWVLVVRVARVWGF